MRALPPFSRDRRRSRARLRRSADRFQALLAGRDGVSAVEFALFAPILFFALIATADLGLALNERMAIDHVLRAGAQTAMADPGEQRVIDVMTATATPNFPPPTDPAVAPDLVMSVSRYYACPEAPDVAVPASTSCAGSAPTYSFYQIGGTKTYSGWIIPDLNLRPQIQVQIR
ncbi:MAG TPA: pilus assembly protein [Aurantimonas coralicida]|uniref:Pilus assembly protein n=2 Tax=root TaxID=1 RepID=A0A9C9NB48_9HYPH|nr:pilus assembly protein [Aurantimonas coralicida]HET98789.1 pilus assembly protein [Aurantimonas coralicida]